VSGCSRGNFADGLPKTSNYYCHPGIAGGSPAYARNDPPSDALLLGQVSRFEPYGRFEIGRGGYVANSNLGNENLRPETFDRSRREVPLRTAESSAETGPWRGKLRQCRAILWPRKSCRDARTSWWSIGDSNHEPLYAVARPRGVASKIVRFMRFAIRRPSVHSRNLAFGPDQNAHLWSR